jgi:hypothetical protein
MPTDSENQKPQPALDRIRELIAAGADITILPVTTGHGIGFVGVRIPKPEELDDFEPEIIDDTDEVEGQDGAFIGGLPPWFSKLRQGSS